MKFGFRMVRGDSKFALLAAILWCFSRNGPRRRVLFVLGGNRGGAADLFLDFYGAFGSGGSRNSRKSYTWEGG